VTGTYKIPQLDCFGNIIHAVASLPVNPDIFEADPTRVVPSFQVLHDLTEVNFILSQHGLQMIRRAGPGMEMRGMRQERMHGFIGKTLKDKVPVIECKSQAGQAFIRLRVWSGVGAMLPRWHSTAYMIPASAARSRRHAHPSAAR